MTDHIHVDPAALREAAGAAGRIGNQLHADVRAHAPHLVDSGAAGGWAASQALGDCADAWETELTRSAQTLHTTSNDLARAAGRYGDVERAIVDVLRDFWRELGDAK
ncbi:type VII secretion target [Amycolatopsis taiwanensis]|nr:type VII secretion target [Amycolatopsis taiwanensis]